MKNLREMHDDDDGDVSMATESEDELEVSETEVLKFDTEIFGDPPEGVHDIDLLPEPQLAPEYAKDVYQFIMLLEDELNVPKHFLEGKPLSYKLRTRLVDWIVQVNHRYQLMQETLYTAVDILDRYLAAADDVDTKHLQLVGCTAMHIASRRKGSRRKLLTKDFRLRVRVSQSDHQRSSHSDGVENPEKNSFQARKTKLPAVLEKKHQSWEFWAGTPLFSDVSDGTVAGGLSSESRETFTHRCFCPLLVTHAARWRGNLDSNIGILQHLQQRRIDASN